MRQRRVKAEGVGGVYHCISRIVGGDFLLEGEREKEVLRNQIWKVADFCGIEVLTYCVMSNHVHILLRTPDPRFLRKIPNAELARRARRIYSPEKADVFVKGLEDSDSEIRERFRHQLLSRMGDVSQYMKELKQRFSIWYNRPRRRIGTLWAERFKSVLVEDDPMALSTVAAYIDLNPVRAGIVDDPAEYRFCGYAEAMGGFKPARLGIASLFGRGEHWAAAGSRYRLAIYGKQSLPKLRPSGEQSVASAKPGRSVDADRAAKAMNAGGRIPRSEALRCRIRYFTDGAVLGSREFVQSYFEANRQRFGARRRDGPRAMKGADWGELSCIRDLRRRAFG
ncbi:MAG: transposase [Verrucomicrobiota bacterium]